MTYHSVSEIYEALEDSRARFAEAVAHLDESAEQFRDTPERWSIAEVAEHVAMVESQIARLLKALVEKAAAEGATAAEADGRIAPVEPEVFAARSLTEKFKAPETAMPRGGKSVADSLARLERAHATLREIRPQVERADGTRVSYSHPLFGPLDLYQWLVMVCIHKDRHARQIEQLKESLAAAAS